MMVQPVRLHDETYAELSQLRRELAATLGYDMTYDATVKHLLMVYKKFHEHVEDGDVKVRKK